MNSNVIPINATAAREQARSVDGKFGVQPLPEVTDIDLTHEEGDPPVVDSAGGDVQPGDQVLVYDRWMEVGSRTRVAEKKYPNPAHNRPGHYVLLCTNGFQKAVRDGETIATVKADENGIPALTKTIRDQVITRNYDSGTPEYAEWCDECSDYSGHIVNNEPMDPRKQLCLGCEDRVIAGYEPQTFGGGGSDGSFVNEHGVDMTPGQTPTGGHL